MKISVIFAHYKTGMMSAYTIAQLLKYKGKHEVEIFVVDNNAGDGSKVYFEPFIKDINYCAYPKETLQSHGVAVDFIMPKITTDYFISLESDAYPIKDDWLDYYEKLINEGYDSAVSLMKLSGGTYGHPCGGLFSKKVWQEAKIYCNEVQYAYFPNFAMKDGFASHTMIHKDLVHDILHSPNDWIELAEGYKGLTRQQIVARMMYYSPVVAPFHNGMGSNDESVNTYGFRTPETEVSRVLLDNKKKIINRVGFEPGQWLYYWQLAMGKKVFHIPTETKWMNDREGEQQEYTLTENGVHHCWGISSYTERPADGVEDIYKEKRELPEKLYNTLPEHQKIKI